MVNGEEKVTLQANIRHPLPDGQRKAFSLIEVMVAVILISIVIAALLQLFGTNSRFLGRMEERSSQTIRSTLLLGIKERGFEERKTELSALVEDFELDDDLRRRLKRRAALLDYQADLQLDDTTLGTTESLSSEEANQTGEALPEEESALFVLEIGRTLFTVDEERTAWTRLRLQ